jgi:hypothetical protein
MGTEKKRRLGRGVASSRVSRWRGFTVYLFNLFSLQLPEGNNGPLAAAKFFCRMATDPQGFMVKNFGSAKGQHLIYCWIIHLHEV